MSLLLHGLRSYDDHSWKENAMRHILAAALLALPAVALAQEPTQTLDLLPQPGNGEYTRITTRLPFTREQKQIWVQKIGDEYVYQGDIVVAKDGFRPLFHGTDDSDERWPDGVVPVVIDQSVFAQPAVLEPLYDAMNALMWQTEIKLVPRTNQRDYVRITMGNMIQGAAARSWVGRQGGAQNLTIGNGFTGPAGIILHELLHASGVYHEQARPDRDYYVYFDLTGLSEEAKQNFDRRDGEHVDQYDYRSIMHYGATAFGVPAGRQTIFCKNIAVPVPCDAAMGQRDAMTQSDIAGLDQLYSEISRFSEGGWNASITRDLDLSSRAQLAGTVRWDSAQGMPNNPNWANGNVDYVRMSISAPTRVVITWGNRQKTRRFIDWELLSLPAYQPLQAAQTQRAVAYALQVPSDVPLRASFELLEDNWGTFPPAPAHCGGLMRCGYGLSAQSSVTGQMQVANGQVAVIDYQISGAWSSRPNFARPAPLVVELELIKRILDKRDWVMRPLEPIHRIESDAPIRRVPIRLPTQQPIRRPGQ
jgi:hypothetical protein